MTTVYSATDNGQPGEAFRAWLTDHGIDPMVTTEVRIFTESGTVRATQLDLDEDGKVKIDGGFVALKTVEVAIKRPAPAYSDVAETGEDQHA